MTKAELEKTIYEYKALIENSIRDIQGYANAMKSVEDESSIFLNMGKIDDQFRMIRKFYDEISLLESQTYSDDISKEDDLLNRINIDVDSLDFTIPKGV